MMKIVTQNLIHTFHLSIGMWMVRRREVQLDLQEATERMPELGCELDPTIRHNM